MRKNDTFQEDIQIVYNTIDKRFKELNIPDVIRDRVFDFLHDLLDDGKRNYSNRKKK